MCLIPACQRRWKKLSQQQGHLIHKSMQLMSNFHRNSKSKAWTGRYKTFKQRRFILSVCPEIQFIVIKYVVQNLQTKIVSNTFQETNLFNKSN